MIGKTISHYRITSKLGEGGMGEVYLAEDTELGRQVALKVLPAEMAEDPERLERFRREAKAVAALNHPNIVTIYSIETAPLEGEDEGEVRFLTMELVEGQSLDKIVPVGGMQLSRVFEIAIPLADALAAAHERGIVHRDLKPANVMVSGEDRVKVLDFGLAKRAVESTAVPADDEATRAATSSATLTREGTVMGTAPYMSPEQLKGKPVDARSDIFSLGIMLYEMATGHRPFKGESGIDLASSILRDTPSSVTDSRADLPRHFGRIVQHCLEKDPRRRFQSALDVRNELDSLRDETRSGEATNISGTGALASGAVTTPGPQSDPSAMVAPEAGTGPSTPVAPASGPQGAADPFGNVTSTDSAATSSEITPSASSGKGARVGLAAAAVILIALAAWWLGRGGGDRKGTEESATPATGEPTNVASASDTPSVAVLPFADLSPDKDQEYFTDGLTEELINVLTQVEPLRVAGRTSSFQFKERSEDLRTIGQKLNVSTILEGSVRKAGDQVRVSAQLVNVEDGLNLWSDTYDRTLEDIFEVQDDIARSVAAALQVTLLGGTQIVSHDVDPKAFNLVLRARYFLLQSTLEATDAAMELLEQALEIDPDYAAAWADLGLVYIRRGEQALTTTDARQGFEKGVEMEEKALELDPTLAVAMTRVAGMKTRLDYDFAGAVSETRRALELAPNDPRVLGNASILEGNIGNLDESIRLLEKACQLDPLHQTLLLNLGIRYFQAGRLEDAEITFDRLLQLNPDYLSAHALLGDVYLWQQRPKAALDELALEDDLISRITGIAMANYALGDEASSDRALEELETDFGDDAAVNIARVYAYRGEPDAAFEWLETAYDSKIWSLVNTKVDPAFDSLHSDPRWQPFLVKIGLGD